MSKFTHEWALWHHSPQDTKWSLDSYNKLLNITNIDEFWTIYNLFDDNNLKYNMLFLMKEEINPLWEDEQNINGGSLSFKIVNNITQTWLELSISLISDKIVNNSSELEKINGISISPKKGFCIIKIWLKNNTNLSYRKFKYLNFLGSIYKPHVNSYDSQNKKLK